MDSVLDIFPALGARWRHPAGRLSGGEQQMLAIARALLTNPTLVLMDDPSEGIAPSIVDTIADAVAIMSAGGVTVLLVEQDLHLAFQACAEIAVLDKGTIAHRAATSTPAQPSAARTPPTRSSTTTAHSPHPPHDDDGAFAMARAVLPGMTARGAGRIVNVISGLAHRPQPGLAAYCASKAALLHLTRVIDAETRDRGVRAFAIEPGLVGTEMSQSLLSMEPRGVRASVIDILKRLETDPGFVQPEESARFIHLVATGRADELAGDAWSIYDPDVRARIAATARPSQPHRQSTPRTRRAGVRGPVSRARGVRARHPDR